MECPKCRNNVDPRETRLCCEKCIKNDEEDIINKPNHYHDSGIDPISIGESILTKEEMNGFYKMNMIKYWYRAGKKDGNSKEQDLKKYEFYKNKLENM